MRRTEKRISPARRPHTSWGIRTVNLPAPHSRDRSRRPVPFRGFTGPPACSFFLNSLAGEITRFIEAAGCCGFIAAIRRYPEGPLPPCSSLHPLRRSSSHPGLPGQPPARIWLPLYSGAVFPCRPQRARRRQARLIPKAGTVAPAFKAHFPDRGGHRIPSSIPACLFPSQTEDWRTTIKLYVSGKGKWGSFTGGLDKRPLPGGTGGDGGGGDGGGCLL